MSDHLNKFYSSTKVKYYLSARLIEIADKLDQDKLKLYLRLSEFMKTGDDPLGIYPISGYIKLVMLPKFTVILQNAIREYLIGETKYIQRYLVDYLVGAGQLVYANELSELFELEN